MNRFRYGLLAVLGIGLLAGSVVTGNPSYVQGPPIRDVNVANTPLPVQGSMTIIGPVDVNSSQTDPILVRDLGTTLNETVFTPQAVNPSQTLQSGLINVDGFSEVRANLIITAPNPDVSWQVLFGPFPNGGFVAAQTGVFSPSNSAMLVVPVHGPVMTVQIVNNGLSSTNVQGVVYAAR